MNRRLLFILGIALTVGCNRDDQQAIRVQQVPKQAEPVMAMPVPSEVAESSQIQWTLPPGWKQLPAQEMRYASFQISPNHPELVVSVTALPVEGGQLLPNVNRWEGQIGLPPSSEADLPKVVRTMDVNGNNVSMVDLTGPATANPQLGMFGAILPRPDRVWFFKLAGPAKEIAPYKESFEAFVKSVHFSAGPDAKPPFGSEPQGRGQAAAEGSAPLPAGHPVIPGAAAAAPSGQITYTAPLGWKKEEPKPMRFASFTIPGDNEQAEAIVTVLPSTSGSYLDNINRWRGQVGLAPLGPNEPQANSPVTVGGIDGNLFDLTGPGDPAHAPHMLVAWVPKGNDWWFFKMTGPNDLIAKQRANFESFLKSVQFVPEKP